ncbi:MAG: hypothetical protein LBS26_06960 [Campylobacteraceae bacterium]|jgi:ribosomal protein L17|nr:hypothetical protein [Campylobacteraceae bacterium]
MSKKIFEKSIAKVPKYIERNGGYTRIIKTLFLSPFFAIPLLF